MDGCGDGGVKGCRDEEGKECGGEGKERCGDGGVKGCKNEGQGWRDVGMQGWSNAGMKR